MYDTEKLITLFRLNRNQENIEPMASYMRHQFAYMGIKMPQRKELFKSFIQEEGWPALDEVSSVVNELWKQPEREFQYLALTFLEKFKKKLPSEFISQLEQLVVSKSWWDTVDGLAASIVGEWFKSHPEEIPYWTEKWMDSGNMWLQRTCLLYQLKYKSKTDLNRLESFIERLHTSKEFFIQKAIGWVLREFSKTNPEYVLQYAETHPLMPLSKREALKIIKKKTS